MMAGKRLGVSKSATSPRFRMRSALQFLKASPPMYVSEVGIVASTSALHPLKALFLIDVTEFGIVT